jgi:hypothetical protein
MNEQHMKMAVGPVTTSTANRKQINPKSLKTTKLTNNLQSFWGRRT